MTEVTLQELDTKEALSLLDDAYDSLHCLCPDPDKAEDLISRASKILSNILSTYENA